MVPYSRWLFSLIIIVGYAPPSEKGLNLVNHWLNHRDQGFSRSPATIWSVATPGGPLLALLPPGSTDAPGEPLIAQLCRFNTCQQHQPGSITPASATYRLRWDGPPWNIDAGKSTRKEKESQENGNSQAGARPDPQPQLFIVPFSSLTWLGNPPFLRIIFAVNMAIAQQCQI